MKVKLVISIGEQISLFKIFEKNAKFNSHLTLLLPQAYLVIKKIEKQDHIYDVVIVGDYVLPKVLIKVILCDYKAFNKNFLMLFICNL